MTNGGMIKSEWSFMIMFQMMPAFYRKTFFVRSAYRNDPEFQVHQLSQRVGDPLDEIRSASHD